MPLATTSHPTTDLDTVGRQEHHVCAVLGLFVTLAVLAVAFDPLAAFTARFGVFATTVLVALVFCWWAVWWQTVEALWNRIGS